MFFIVVTQIGIATNHRVVVVTALHTLYVQQVIDTAHAVLHLAAAQSQIDFYGTIGVGISRDVPACATIHGVVASTWVKILHGRLAIHPARTAANQIVAKR